MIPGISPLFGIDIIVSPSLEHWRREQWRFPRSKRKRIRRKWAKQARNWRSVLDRIDGPYWMGMRVICAPRHYAEVRRMLEAR